MKPLDAALTCAMAATMLPALGCGAARPVTPIAADPEDLASRGLGPDPGAQIARTARGHAEWLVRVDPGADLAGLSVVNRDLADIGYLTVEMPGDLAIRDAARRLAKTPGVVEAQPSYVYQLDQPVAVRTAGGPVASRAAKVQNDPAIGQQYHLGLLRALQAWEVQPGSRKVRLALLDTGVDPGHPELRGQLDPDVGLYNAIMRNRDVLDRHGHGTHTAGIAAAAAANGAGGAGVAPGVSLMAIQVLSANGSGNTRTIAAGFLYAANNGAHVLNASLAVGRRDKAVEAAIQYALDKDVVVVASAGNMGRQNDPEKAPHLPSTYPGVVEVAATDAQDRVAEFSNYGKTVSVAAPGVDVWSTLPIKNGVPGYGLMSGTSMAAPCAAGVAALIRSQVPGLARAQVKARLEARARDLGAPGFDPRYGWGRVDALDAVSQ